MPRITISYRRDDSGVITGRIFDRLAGHYSREAVFRDIDNIPPGADFRKHIDTVLDQSDIVLAIVGPKWIGPRANQSRLANPADPVRVEIEAALRKDKPLIPVLVLRGSMPRIEQLPETLHDFAYRNAVTVDAGQDFDLHIARLIRAMDRILDVDAERAAADAVENFVAAAEAAPAISAATIPSRPQEQPPVAPPAPKPAPAVEPEATRESEPPAPPRRRGLLVGVAVAAAVLAAGWYLGSDRRLPSAPTRTAEVAAPPAPAPAPVAVPTPSPSPPVAASAPAKPGETFRDCPDCPEMVWLPAGRFMMGTEAAETTREGMPEQFAMWERPRHEVTVRTPFAIGKFHVTRGEYARFVDATQRDTSGGCYYYDGTKVGLDAAKSWRDPGFPQTDRDPAVCISWDDAKAYVAWLSEVSGKTYRLPSEAEWEYAARGGTQTARWWGDDANDMCRYANVADFTAKEKFSNWTVAQCRDGFVYTSPAGSFQPNAFGLYDMLGNAWQWVEDCWNENYGGAPKDSWVARSSGDCSRRVARGGSWGLIPRYVRSGYRIRDGTGDRFNNTGFRVARTE